eukprot:3245830-Amphidinium_carterae.1
MCCFERFTVVQATWCLADKPWACSSAQNGGCQVMSGPNGKAHLIQPLLHDCRCLCKSRLPFRLDDKIQQAKGGAGECGGVMAAVPVHAQPTKSHHAIPLRISNNITNLRSRINQYYYSLLAQAN